MKRIQFPFSRKSVFVALLLLVIALPGLSQIQTNIILSNPISFKATTGDKLSLYDNRIGNSSMYGMGVESNALYFRSNGDFRFYSEHIANGGNASIFSIKETGRVGIGTDLPESELQINGDYPVLSLRDQYSNNQVNAARIELMEYDDGLYHDGAFLHYNGQADRMTLGINANNANRNLIMLNHATNNVGIGTFNDNANYKLLVAGAIRAEEVVLETGWADYVFEDDYKLRSLSEVECFIEENGHLPDVPSAEEVESNGVRIAEMESTLLRKVEELTLYLIDLKKTHDALQTELVDLQGNK